MISPETGESLPLDDFIATLIEGRESGAIRLVGGAGSGKTTALRHLASLVPPHLKVSFLDEPSPGAIDTAARSRGWVVYTSHSRSSPGDRASNLQLAPWGEDEWIEYLLATDRRLCSSVMARLAAAKPAAAMLGGSPELWRLVLDRMMENPSIPGPALRHQKRSRGALARRRGAPRGWVLLLPRRSGSRRLATPWHRESLPSRIRKSIVRA